MPTEHRQPHVTLGISVLDAMHLLNPTLVEMRRRGWRTKVVASPGPLAADYPDVDFHFIEMTRGITPPQDARAVGEWVRLLRKDRPDVVIGSTAKAGTTSMVAARLTRVPVRILQARGARWDGMDGPQGRLLRRIDQLTAASSTHVVSVSQSLADLFVESGVSRRRPVVLGSGGSKGVDVDRFQPRPKPEGEPLTMGFVGRLSRDKGIEDLLTVFETCRQSIPDCRLTVVGGVDAAQPIDATVQHRLQQPGISWLGVSRRVPEILPTFDVLVFPSIREGLPNAVIEAAAAGVPTAGYDVTGVRDAVIDRVTGRLVPVGDVAGLARATLSLLGDAPSEQVKRACREMAVNSFAQERVINQFVDYVESLLPSGSG